MHKQYFPQRCCMFLVGIFTMTLGIALSCKADLGTSPISSVPWVMSMFMPWSIGEITIVMNLLFIIAQPILLRQFYWRKLLGQLATLLAFGYCIDFSMSLLSWVAPDTLFWQWFDCILSTILLAFAYFSASALKFLLLPVRASSWLSPSSAKLNSASSKTASTAHSLLSVWQFPLCTSVLCAA